MAVSGVSTVAAVIAIICISTLLGLRVATWRLQQAWRRFYSSYHRLNQQWSDWHQVQVRHVPCAHCALQRDEVP